MGNVQVLPRSVGRETALVQEGVCRVRIIIPAAEEYREVAGKLADAIAEASGSRPLILTDEQVMPGRLARLPDEFRQSPLILLGNVNTNRLFTNLYARCRCLTDADYPGGDGYELRTVINPYTRGNNIIIAGGSTRAGVGRAIDCLVEIIGSVGQPGQVVLPFLIHIAVEPALKNRLDEYPFTDLNAPEPDMSTNQGYEIMRVVGHYGLMYAATGDRRYGDYAARCLRLFNDHHSDSYGDRHYFMERLLIGIYWLQAGGFFSDEEVYKMDRLLLGTLIKAQNNWWRRKDGEIPLGHRHQSKGTYEFLLQARFLKENADLSPTAQAETDRWIEECQSFMDALCRACIDDQDDETTLNNMSNLFWYSLGQERYDFFESGNAKQAALRALALTDNMGAGAGQGGYGESHMSAMYTQVDATTAVAASAFYYQDGRFKWLLEHIPFLKEPLRGSIFTYCPIFLHNFATGESLPEQAAEGLVGIQALPVTEHQYRLNTEPPEHVVPLGHFVNEPETWQLAEGVGQNHLSRAEGFDKLTLRESFQPEAAYLLLQGYQGGYNWQGHQQAANCIVRFSQYGKIFLIQNSRQHTAYDKNGVLVSSGWDSAGLSPYARLDGRVESERLGVTITSLPEDRGAEWRRHLLWSKPGGGYFVVVDTIYPHEAGEYSLTCTWRTPAYAAVDGRTLTSGQGAYTFHITAGEDLSNRLAEEPSEGAASPFVWRQYKGGPYPAGGMTAFHNLLYARPEAEAEDIRLFKVSERAGWVQRQGKFDGWYCVDCRPGSLPEGGLVLETGLVWDCGKEIVLVNALRLVWPGGEIHAETPFSLALRPDGTGMLQSAQPVTALAAGCADVILHPGPVALDRTAAALLFAASRAAGLALAEMKTPVVPTVGAGKGSPILTEAWRVAAFGLEPEHIRDVRIACEPNTLNGFDEQLVDGVPLELREFWAQWPASPEYHIRLRFPNAPGVDTLRLIGDSLDEPMLRVFSPLPDAIQVASLGGGLAETHRVESVPEIVSFRRYRGQLDRTVGHRAVIGRRVESIDLRIPAPRGRPLIFQEIEIYGSRTVPSRVRHILADDLTGTGEQQTVIITDANEIILLDASGRECWRQNLPGAVYHLSCLDLLGDGRKQICLGILGGELRILTAEGQLFRSVALSYQYKKPISLFGWMETLLSLAIWRRDANGRAALAVGSYATVIFLDPDFNILGHSFVDGSWIYNILAAPPAYSGDIWVRCGWNHGISVYQGLDSFAASGSFADFGGVQQPMFRAIRQVIPFANGSSVAFRWIDRPGGPGRILAAAEFGVGLMDADRREWVWMARGLPRITGCLSKEGSALEIITAAMDGFVCRLDGETGRPLQRRWLGGPVVGLAQFGDTLLAATPGGLYQLDARLNVTGCAPVHAARLLMSGDTALVVDENNSLHGFHLPDLNRSEGL